MSDYQGNIIIKNPATPTGPASTGRAPGMWKLNDVAYWIKQGVWPNPAIVPDPQFPYVSLLLSTTSLGNANNNLFVDSSGVFNPMARVGNTTQGSITPYGSNWSNYFDGNGDYLTAADNAVIQFGTGNFTVEGWFNLASYAANQPIFDQRASGGSASAFVIYVKTTGTLAFYSYSPGIDVTFNTVISTNAWNHFAFVRSGNTGTMYVNGVAQSTTIDLSAYNNTSSANRIMQSFDPSYATGYLSNFRIVKGTAVYTGNFTPPTAPLTAISGTGLLTCQSNRFIDNSGNNLTITAYGDTRVTDFSPFSPPYPGASYNQNEITNWSGWFNGGTDRVQVPVTSNMYLGTTYTIEAWAYYNSTSYGARPIFSQMEPFQGGFAGLTLTLNTSGRLVAEYRPATGGAVTTITGPTVTPYTWFHIALVSDNSSAKLYVNGTQVGSTTTFGDYPSAKTNTVAVGSWGSGWNDGGIPAAAWIGYISNLRVVKGAAVYTGNFTPSTTPLTAISGTVLLTCQNAAFTDNSSVNNILTPVSNAAVTGNSPFNTVGYWSNYFDGTDDEVLAPNTPANFGSSNFTAECWVMFTSNTAGYQMVMGNQGTGDGQGWVVYTETNNQLTFAYSTTNGGWAGSISTGITPPVNVWTHLAIVRNGTAITFYVNGTAYGTPISTSSAIASPTGNFRIGRYPYFPGGARTINAYISNVRLVNGTAVYTSNFTPSTIPLTAITNTSLLTCQSSRFADTSSNAYAITIGGNPSVQSFDPFYTATITSNGGSVYFDGSSYLATQNIPSNAIRSADCTIESWVQFTSPGANSDTPFFGNYTGTWTTNSIYWGKHTAYSGRVAFWVNNYSPSTALLVDTSLPTGSWHHYAVTRSGSTWRMFRDGVVVATATWSGDATGSNGLITPGRADVLHLNGYLSDMRVVNGTAMYTSAFTPPTAPLTPTPATVFLLNGMNAGAYDATAINDMTTVGNAQVRYPSPFAPANYYAGAFDGSGDYLTLSGGVTNNGTGDLCLEFWSFYTGSYSGEAVAFDSRTSPFTNGFAVTAANSTGNWTMNFTVQDILTSTPVSINQWDHVAVTRSGNTFRLFVNGILQGTLTSSNNLTSTTNVIGSSYNFGSNWPGYISNLRAIKGSIPTAYQTSSTTVGTRVFTPPTEPLTAVSGTSLLTCQNKTFIDNSSNAFAITAVGNATAGAFGPFTATGGTSMYFGGLNNWLDFPANPTADFGTGDITIECWLYVTSTATSYQSICQFGNAAVTSGFHILTNNNTICLRTNNSQPLTTSGTFTANTWNHIALTRASGTTRIFINGTTSGGTYNWTASLSSGSTRRIGGDIYSNALTGYIDDFRVTRGVARYTSNFTPPTQPFPIY